MNCKDTKLLRIVRGNGFKLKIAVEAYTTGGRRVESFSVDEAELKLYKNGSLTAKEYTILEGTTILVEFDGSDALGIYGFQMVGTFEEEDWRWANWNVFQIVETTEKAHIPEGCVVLDDTYNMAAKIVLSGGDGVTFTPSVSDQGIISWTNDGGLPNPEPRNIRGPQGERGPQGPQGERGPQGPQGPAGSDADVTAENIRRALGYTPQEQLVIGVNIKTVNGKSLLGSGDVSVGTYILPRGGIPSTDLASGVQTSLGKADTAVQPAAIENMEVTTNKVTSISSSSTDTQYPSAKCVYDLVGDIETLLAAI